MRASSQHSAKDKILEAALSLIRTKGYEATTVDDLCAAAGVTKGAFFHHFGSKEDLAAAAANHWSEVTGALFAEAAYHKHDDPLDRVLGDIDFHKALLAGVLPQAPCLVGMMVQDAYDTHPAIRDACTRSIMGHAAKIEPDIRAAIAKHDINPAWT